MSWNPFKKSAPIEKKEVILPESLINFLLDTGHTDLADAVAIDLYSTVGPLATAVNKVSNAVAGLVPIVYNKNTNEYLDNHPVLDLLKNPNADQTKTEFLKRVAAYYLVTGDSFVVATGQVNKPPLELWAKAPSSVYVSPDGSGYPGMYSCTSASASFDFTRKEVNGRWRFYEGGLRELWHLKTFNPAAEALRGQSILTPIFRDIEQFKFASTHNLSLLKRGARPSGVFISPEGLTDDQYQRLKSQIDNFYTGSNNAGRPLLVEGNGMTYQDAMLSARDMDFMALKNNVTTTIYNHMGIPLPLIDGTSQTYANMKAAKLQLYQDTALPLADRIFEELSLFLMPRYKDNANLSLTYDKSQIEALKLEVVETLTLYSKLGIFTINELRTEANYEGLEIGGDDVLRPASDIPIGRDAYTGDQDNRPSRKKFFALMEGKGLSNEELNAYANKHGLV